ncbi:MAG: MFS transporter [Rhodospirillaceae bacterium]|nr:MFS transporter [Rhodospirillaceae bacterium]
MSDGPARDDDPRGAIARLPMHRMQIVVVVLCIALNALDGFDVLSISFAAPGIAAEWGIEPAMLGVVLSMELLGMAAGSILIGNLADRIGRRPTILSCLVVMAVGMFTAAFADRIWVLSAARLLTGLGIGGMIASTSALVAEFSSDKRRDLNMALNIAGYTLGVVVGGAIVSSLIAELSQWRSVFLFGGAVTALAIPLAYFYLPESIGSLLARRPTNALEQINATLKRMDIAPIAGLPPIPAQTEKPSIAVLFSARYAPMTILLSVAYFAGIMCFYFVQKWTPKIVVDLGFDPSQAGRVLVCANIGAFLGGVAIGLASQRFKLRPVIIGSMILAFIMVTIFGLGYRDLVVLSVLAGIAGFFVNSSMVGMYPIFAQTFPETLRASGTGFVIGMGRGASALGPVVAGFLFANGFGLSAVAAAMASGMLVAAVTIALLTWVQSRPRA